MLVRGICIAQMPLTFIHTIINSMLLFPPEIILELTLYIVGEVAITIRNTVMLRHDSKALIYKNLTCRFTSIGTKCTFYNIITIITLRLPYLNCNILDGCSDIFIGREVTCISSSNDCRINLWAVTCINHRIKTILINLSISTKKCFMYFYTINLKSIDTTSSQNSNLSSSSSLIRLYIEYNIIEIEVRITHSVQVLSNHAIGRIRIITLESWAAW